LRKLDLTGHTQGNLTFLHKAGSEGGRAMWLVECSCGRRFTMRASSTSRGRQCRSCASSGPRPDLCTGYEDINGTQWGAIRNHARQRGISFEVTIEQAWNKFVEQNGRCILTGVKITHAQYRHDPSKTASLDRIDSSKSYTIDNVQWVHKTVNFMKHTLTNEELLRWCRRVVKNAY